MASNPAVALAGRLARVALVSAGVALSGIDSAGATLTPDEVDRLGRDLTPVGAERAGNAAGTIPAWTGGLPMKAIDPAAGYADPYAQDPILFTITAANAAEYRDRLSAGHLELLARHPGTFRVNVYPTRRSAAWPEAVLAQVRQQAIFARTDGDRLLDVGRSAVPFPITAAPLQMMWNHTLRWRGGSVKREFIWAPVTSSGRYFTVRSIDAVAFDQQGYMQQARPNRLFNLLGIFLAPPNLEGQLVLVWEPVDPVAESRTTWIYETLLRRVRQVPSLAYDDLDPRTQGLRTVDQYDGWNGAPDLYDWKLVGKREMFIAYNGYKLADKKLKYADILRPGTVNPELLRYELHRVWVIEATLRPGKTHRYPKRIFYPTRTPGRWRSRSATTVAVRCGASATTRRCSSTTRRSRGMRRRSTTTSRPTPTLRANEEKLAWTWGWKGEINDFLPGNLRRLGTR